MSSLIFHTEPEQVFVAADTLATLEDGRPLMFTTKSFILPHLKMIICGTGLGGFLGQWFVEINDRMVVLDIDNLDYHTPKMLRKIWQDEWGKYSNSKLTTTVYHFGFSLEEGIIHSYAYRSENNFKSEPLMEFGMRVKPRCNVPENYALPNDIKKMMEEQRSIQCECLEGDRIHIGGEIIINHLTKDGYNVYTAEKFDDFVTTEKAIFENF